MGDLVYMKGRAEVERKKYEEASAYCKQEGNDRSYALALRDISKKWAMTDSLEKALSLMTEAEAILLQKDDAEALSSVTNGLGNIYYILGDLEMAKQTFAKSLALEQSDQAPSLIALCKIYMKQGDLDSARSYLQKSQIDTRNKLPPL